MIARGAACVAVLSVAGCVSMTEPRIETTATHSPPNRSGLVDVRPYPAENDVCRVIGENDVTSNYLDHTALLIACPAHERGAITDRVDEGAQRLDHIGAWILLSVPAN